MPRHWALVACAYVGLALLGAGISVAVHGGSPFAHPTPLMRADPWWVRHAVSSGVGLGFALVLVAVTRWTVTRVEAVRRLHLELRPVVVGMSLPGIALVSVLSSLGEELFFRSLLAPLIGVPLQAVLFGAAHQTRSATRWVWMVWAASVGLALGYLYSATGSLVGAVVAHAVVNAVNLQFLRDHDPTVPASSLGGLLGAGSGPKAGGGE